MVPGMTERERLAADVRRLEWLSEARFGPTQPPSPGVSPMTAAAAPISIMRRVLTAARGLGNRVPGTRPRPIWPVPKATARQEPA